MRFDRLTLMQVRLPLKSIVAASNHANVQRTHILVRAEGEGLVAWGEAPTMSDPYYVADTVDTTWLALDRYLCPRILGRAWGSADEFIGLWSPVKGHAFAKSALEMACWDALGKRDDRSLADLIGATRQRVPMSATIGIQSDAGLLAEKVAAAVATGVRRIKLKITPSSALAAIRTVRDAAPDVPLAVDANESYAGHAIESVCRLADAGADLIEQPYAADDWFGHARLQERLGVVVCLDESITRASDIALAAKTQACRGAVIKASRLGGIASAVAAHATGESLGIALACGGMYDYGLSRAACLAVSGLPGFALVGDLGPSSAYYERDIVTAPISARGGMLELPSGAGLGVEVDEAFILDHTIESATYSAPS